MRWIVAPMLFVVTSLVFAGGDAKDVAKKFINEIEGEWKIETGRKNGDDLPDEARQNLTLIFEGTKLFVRDQTGEKKEGMTFKIDTTTKPFSFDVVHTRDKKMQEGIIELKGDVLKICIHEGAVANRPTEFASAAGSEKVNVELKRVKK